MSIRYRLLLALLGATAAVVLCMFFLLQWSVDRGFLRYVNTVEQERFEALATELERSYTEGGGWEFLLPDPGRSLRRMFNERLDEPGSVPPRGEGRIGSGRSGGRPPLGQMRRLVLLDGQRHPLFGSQSPAGDVVLRPLRVDGEVVGYLGLQARQELTDIHQLRFVEQQKLAMALVAAFIFLISAGLAYPLASRLLRPVRALAEATHNLAAGRYATRVPAQSPDELGQLARDFNVLALTLEKNEQARRQWVADISHELRTPLAVLRGEIESLQDGVRQATPAAIRSLHAEVMHLGHLVDDLHQLALSDLGALTYRKEQINLTELLTDVLEGFSSEMDRRGLVLQTQIPTKAVELFADGERLRQLFVNLLDNSLKYTDLGGRIEVLLERRKGEARVHLRDSAPGVPAAELEKLFERFYRVDSSRRRTTGGAGLGLAICRNIVEAHGGSLQAHPSPLGGLWLEVGLPLAEEGR
ncbi:MAG: HAMP domain-containing protein [Desulfuromonadales bacterium]|nr:HAMP domain-containing protein [Desulfuromonadales bacterium]